QKVLILGASGGVGTASVMLAKLAGAEVIAAAGSAEKLARLKALGADHLINYTASDFVSEIQARYGKPQRRSYEGGIDVVVNYTGGDTWVPSLKVLKRGGRLLVCGATAGFNPTEDLRYIWSFELKILGSNAWARASPCSAPIRPNTSSPISRSCAPGWSRCRSIPGWPTRQSRSSWRMPPPNSPLPIASVLSPCQAALLSPRSTRLRSRMRPRRGSRR